MKRPFRLVQPVGAHPLVHELFEIMVHRETSILALAHKSGVDKQTIRNWRGKSNPRLHDLDACFTALGYKLSAVPRRVMRLPK